jgi:predicted DNA-binding protein
MDMKDRVIAKADDQAVSVRFPPGLLERLDAASKRAGRSRNSEIVVRLTESLDGERKRAA